MSDQVSLTPALRQKAMLMRRQLEQQRLTVVLVPAPYNGRGGRMIRSVEDENPGWYQDFCADYETRRSKPRRTTKPDTLIKRRHTLRALKEIEGGVVETEYARRLLPWIETWDPGRDCL